MGVTKFRVAMVLLALAAPLALAASWTYWNSEFTVLGLALLMTGLMAARISGSGPSRPGFRTL